MIIYPAAACGAANGKTITQAPSAPTDLCGGGNLAATVTATSGGWTWSCAAGSGANATTTSCAATQGPTVATCGSDNGQFMTSTPTNLCSGSGTASSVTQTNGLWMWSCVQGSTTAQCGASPATSCSATGKPITITSPQTISSSTGQRYIIKGDGLTITNASSTSNCYNVIGSNNTLNINSTGGNPGADTFNVIGASNTLQSMASYNQYAINGSSNTVMGNSYANIIYEPDLGSYQTFVVSGDNNVIHDSIGYSFFSNNNLTIVGNGTQITSDWGMSRDNGWDQKLGGGNIINVTGNNTSVQGKEIDYIQMTVSGNNTSFTSSGLSAQGLQMGACTSDSLNITGTGTNISCNGLQYSAVTTSGDNTTLTAQGYISDAINMTSNYASLMLPCTTQSSTFLIKGTSPTVNISGISTNGGCTGAQGDTFTIIGDNASLINTGYIAASALAITGNNAIINNQASISHSSVVITNPTAGGKATINNVITSQLVNNLTQASESFEAFSSDSNTNLPPCSLTITSDNATILNGSGTSSSVNGGFIGCQYTITGNYASLTNDSDFFWLNALTITGDHATITNNFQSDGNVYTIKGNYTNFLNNDYSGADTINITGNNTTLLGGYNAAAPTGIYRGFFWGPNLNIVGDYATITDTGDGGGTDIISGSNSQINMSDMYYNTGCTRITGTNNTITFGGISYNGRNFTYQTHPYIAPPGTNPAPTLTTSPGAVISPTPTTCP